MGSQPNQSPLVVIVGETGSGKSSLAIELAKLFNGEIIAADSRTIYRGMDIGTAKPTIAERTIAAHHIIDVVDPDQPFTAADFKRLAEESISDIASRGKLPIMVGGTGLYVDSVLYDFTFSDQPNIELRESLQGLNVTELQQMIKDKGLQLPENDRNPRHLMRTIETNGVKTVQSPLRANTLVIGIETEREVLRERITKRVQSMLSDGLISEVARLVSQFGWDAPGLQSPGYRTFRQYLGGQGTVEEAQKQLITEHMQLAKRQRTWFRRNKNINWLCKKEEVVDLVTTFLNKVYTDK